MPSTKTIRPIAARALGGIAYWEGKLIAIDTYTGYLLQIDPLTENTNILNSDSWSNFVGATGLAIADNTLWFTVKEQIYYCDLQQLKPQLFKQLDYQADGVAVWQNTVYVSTDGYIQVFGRDSAGEITRFYAPGIGRENIAVHAENLWLTDTLEQSVYCLDRATGELICSMLTPFECPTGITLTPEGKIYVAYAGVEPYIRDNPNAEPNYELQYRDRTFIHPLSFYYNQTEKYTLSNGYLVEMSYVEEISPLDPVEITDLEWRIALPAETPRQKIRKIEPIGLPFTEEENNGQKIAVFKLNNFNSQQRYIFGWKAQLELWSIKYQLTPADCEDLRPLPDELKSYLEDNDDLAMDTEIIRHAASSAIGTETNLLRQVYSIRNYVYDKLSYGIKPQIDTPDIVLRRGVGSCGEYLGLLLALTRLNGIASRTVGRYKCPLHPEQKHQPLIPDFNHVWMEFYLPGIGWLPMESNPDDVNEGGPYPTRFFMGLAWYHAEMAKEIPFSRITSEGKPIDKKELSIGELAINHIRFTILEELTFET